MTVPFMKTGNTVSILAQGKWYQVKPEHPNYSAILEALHGSEEEILKFLDIGSSLEDYSSGNVELVADKSAKVYMRNMNDRGDGTKYFRVMINSIEIGRLYGGDWTFFPWAGGKVSMEKVLAQKKQFKL